MKNVPWLTILVLLPIVGSLAVALLPGVTAKLAKLVAIGFSVATLAIGVGLALGYDADGGYQFTENLSWIKLFSPSS
jgi:NADH-quinone oxidoreductase subunit M